ncbi:unnamed protein product [Arabidopsis thaliana]|uniref:SAG101 n=2 Tax=Arabidopsis thaliana TaxID=3702 RepID=A0A5S9Y6F5_ARATH|nr:unnamed protein product [Arabidopsis thaliana]
MESSSSLKGSALGKLVVTSGLLHSSWSKILEIHNPPYSNQDPGLQVSKKKKDSGLEFQIHREEKFTLVVFSAPPICRSSSSDSTLLHVKDKENPFPFLCSENNPSFSLHTPAFNLFTSASTSLTYLKSELLQTLKSEKPVIITGAALGGSVASLYTLWLLETIEPTLKRPLCITFGSPLIGDASLQQILENSVRNSCFLHVVSAQTRIKMDFFKPFGTFLICFDSGCVCIEDHVAVTELLNGVHDSGLVDYSQVLNRLDQSMLSLADSRLIPEDVIKGIEKRAEMKNLRFDMMFKKLNDMKISMAYIEWYKKKCKEVKIGYYDRFKTQLAFPSKEFDINIKNHHKSELNRFWKSVVEEVERRPQSDASILKRRFLFSGNNYRRMIEPLDIAEYYLEGRKEYRTTGRSHHYVMLEKWFGMESILIEKERCKKRDLSDLLTFDSCFWAEVEDSLIVINQLNTTVGMRDDVREVLTRKLVEFEGYVWEIITKREVSPEIFLEESSFMKWWKEYKKIKGFNSSYLTEFMNTRKYESYGKSQ